MQKKRVLRAGAAGALGVTLCFCGLAQAGPGKSENTGVGASSKLPAELQIGALGTDQIQVGKALGLTTTPRITPWHKISIRSGNTLSGVFSRAGLGASQWRQLLDLGSSTETLRQLHPGDVVEIRKTPTGNLAELRYRLDSIRTLHVKRVHGKLQATVEQRATQTREITATGTVGKSLSHSMSADGVPASIADRVIHIYRYRHNLRHLHRGDTFAVIYRATYSEGEQIATGPVLAARITTNHNNYKAFRAKDANGDFGYFDASGTSYQPAFTRKPVAYTRISSPFSLHRLDPVTHTVRPHKGVDMAAPIGTPIHAAAEGTVKYAGWAHGYGRLVELTNFDGYSTRYAHMHKIRSKLHIGEHVRKGQVIGYVGESGQATGPHLHFEIRLHGVAHNPLTMKLPSGHSLPSSQMDAYKREIQPLIARLSPTPTTLLANTTSTPMNSCNRAVSLNATLALDPVGAAGRHSLSHMFCMVRGRHHHATNA